MKKNKSNLNYVAIVSAAIAISLLLISLFLYTTYNRTELLDLSKNSLMRSNYYINSMQCTNQANESINICAEVFYRASNNSSLPNRVAIARYLFSDNYAANSYLNQILNGTNSSIVNSSGLKIFYASTPFINGQTVFTSYLVSNRTIWSTSSLFNYTQPKAIAERFTLNLTYIVNEKNNS